MAVDNRLPKFIYHPDPVRTGSVKLSDTHCKACGQRRGYIYVGPLSSEGNDEISEELQDAICPWCIADGTAHNLFGLLFNDVDYVIGGQYEKVPETVDNIVKYRTPGFFGWQQERWFAHCGDAGAFLGHMGRLELNALGAQAIQAIRAEFLADDEQWAAWYQDLDKDGSPTAYMFQCLHCGIYGGYSDCD